ncbi:MAG: transaldolase [Candidatus Helarchaeota archaeon]|nr:transaldolase [Candidatus Helarchaeota archaeon]
MEIFIDSANPKEIEKWVRYGIADGVTTNPTIMLKDGITDMKKGAKEIAALLNGKPVSVEVITDNPEEMLSQAREFSSWAKNIVIKIPIINQHGEPCLEVINTLENEGIRVNATGGLSFGQMALSTKAGATYSSIFAGRVADEGSDPWELVSMSVEWLEFWGYKTKIIVGSIRNVIDIQNAAVAGAHIVTVPPQFLTKWVDHKYSRETIKQFMDDAKKAFKNFKK